MRGGPSSVPPPPFTPWQAAQLAPKAVRPVSASGDNSGTWMSAGLPPPPLPGPAMLKITTAAPPARTARTARKGRFFVMFIIQP